MSRLTARTETGHAYLVNVKPDEQEVDSPHKNTLQCILDCFERLAQYEDAEEQGRCVVLPCKVGDTVYVLPNYSAYWDDIEETKITGVSQFPTKSGVSNQIVTSIGLCYEWERDFGVRLFSTRAEAEAALQKGGAAAMSEMKQTIYRLERVRDGAPFSLLYPSDVEDALTALREKAERSRGCEWCKALSFNPDIGGCQLVFFKSKKHPKGEHAISVSVFDEYGEEQEPVLVQIDNCIRCGRRLEVESIDAGTIGGEMVQRALKKLEGEP